MVVQYMFPTILRKGKLIKILPSNLRENLELDENLDQNI